ncbi:hypothetical protein HDV05_005133 [Chytridiales sp. JEL 0842]|nr:hypothetical protein HDV05_005133 [Chytridiales sp. JEL 0842]
MTQTADLGVPHEQTSSPKQTALQLKLALHTPLTNSQPTSSTVTTYTTSLRRLTISFDPTHQHHFPTWPQFLQIISNAHGFPPAARNDADALRVTYTDKEGDEIQMSSTEEWHEFLKVAGESEEALLVNVWGLGGSWGSHSGESDEEGVVLVEDGDAQEGNAEELVAEAVENVANAKKSVAEAVENAANAADTSEEVSGHCRHHHHGGGHRASRHCAVRFREQSGSTWEAT